MGEDHAVPIEYSAIVLAEDGHESHLDLDEPGWRGRDDVLHAAVVTFRPKPGHEELPTVSVHVGLQQDGSRRDLFYMSRLYGTLSTSEDNVQTQTDRFRIYAIGWEQAINVPHPDAAVAEPYATLKVRHVNWVIPLGSVIMADEPPQAYVDDLIMHYSTRDLPHTNTPEQAVAGGE